MATQSSTLRIHLSQGPGRPYPWLHVDSEHDADLMSNSIVPAVPDQTLQLPLGVRVSLWLAIGTALGIPVDAIFAASNLQLVAAKRQLGGKRLHMRMGERLKAAQLATQLTEPFRNLIQWIVSPASLVRWLKRYQEREANSGAPNHTGRPWILPEKVEAILKIYDSGLTGLKRIVGEMEKCGLPVAKSTVRRVLTKHGRPPTDAGPRGLSTWAKFLRLHAPYIMGADFIQVPVGLLGKVVNAHVFFGIEHQSRHVHLLGITINPTDAWVANCLRSISMMGAPCADHRYWILDNDGKFGQQTAAVLGKRLVHTCIRSPDMNAIAERFIGSIRRECLDHVVFLSEQMLRDYVEAYIAHYNRDRPHQGIGNVPIGPWKVGTSEIMCDESLNGLLKSFRRAA